jgi:hypothetical protein
MVEPVPIRGSTQPTTATIEHWTLSYYLREHSTGDVCGLAPWIEVIFSLHPLHSLKHLFFLSEKLLFRSAVLTLTRRRRVITGLIIYFSLELGDE